MSKAWARVLAVMVLAAPVGAADEKKELPEQSIEAHASKTRGAIQVKGDTTDWFEVYKGGKAVTFPHPLLGATAEVEPGEYEVVVNKTTRKVKVEAGKKVVLLTGTLVVEGKGGLYWYPLADGERKVAANRNNPALNTRIALFPGTYRAEVNVNLRSVESAGEARVTASGKSALKR
jgi:hypothetical protein